MDSQMKTKVLFVCLGNICRSPLAEGLFLHKIKEMGLSEKFLVDSAGTSNYHIGAKPDARTAKSAEKHGIYLPSRGRQFNRNDFYDFDYIMAMDKSNLINILEKEPAEPESKANVLMMRDFDNLGKGLDVPDPYYGGEDGFDLVYQILNRSTDAFLQFLLAEPKP